MAAATTQRRRGRVGNDTERLDLRVDGWKKKAYARAAEIAGESLTAFALAAMDARAAEVMRAHDTTALTPEESVAFIELLSAPLAPNPRLIARFAEYEAYFGKER